MAIIAREDQSSLRPGARTPSMLQPVIPRARLTPDDPALHSSERRRSALSGTQPDRRIAQHKTASMPPDQASHLRPVTLEPRLPPTDVPVRDRPAATSDFAAPARQAPSRADAVHVAIDTPALQRAIDALPQSALGPLADQLFDQIERRIRRELERSGRR